MTNSLGILKPRDDRGIAPTTVWAIREIKKAADKLGLSAFLVGATARTIVLENVFGLSAGRTSYDVDFAFALESWQQFNAIKQYLVMHSSFEEIADVPQRLVFVSPGDSYRIFVDLIPFGGIEGKSTSISWPPDMSVIMNVAGYKDALTAALHVEVEPGLIIPVASLSGMAILKLFAWSDRGQENPKDAIDFVSLLRGYYEAGNMEKIYENAAATLESVGYDPELAGAWLIGLDAANIASENTRNEIVSLLQDENKVRYLIQDMSRNMHGKANAIEFSEELLHQFITGFTTQL
jgi:predicted nucleotidyltransferase